MHARLLTVAIISAALLLGCSNDDTTSDPISSDSGAEMDDSADQFFVGGISCSNSASSTIPDGVDAGTDDTGSDSSPASQVDNQVTADPVVDIDCLAELDTALPGPGVGKTGTGSLTHDGNETALSAATIDYDAQNNFDNTTFLTLTLHDGDTRSSIASNTVEGLNETATITRVDWGIYNATIAFTVELNQVNADAFTGGSFEIRSAEEFSQQDNSNYAILGFLLLDKNSDATITPESEFISAISGNVNVSGESPDWAVTLDVTLEDETALTGVYNGSFHSLPVH